MFDFRLKFIWSLLLKVQLIIFSIGWDNGLVPSRRQSIISTNDGYVSLPTHICFARPQKLTGFSRLKCSRENVTKSHQDVIIGSGSVPSDIKSLSNWSLCCRIVSIFHNKSTCAQDEDSTTSSVINTFIKTLQMADGLNIYFIVLLWIIQIDWYWCLIMTKYDLSVLVYWRLHHWHGWAYRKMTSAWDGSIRAQGWKEWLLSILVWKNSE